MPMQRIITIALVIIAMGLYPAYAHQFIDAAAALATSLRIAAGANHYPAFNVIVLIATVIMVARWR